MGRRGAADGVEHQLEQPTGGGVRLPDAPPSHRNINYDVTRMTSYYVGNDTPKRRPAKRFSKISKYKKFSQEFDLGPKHAIEPIRYIPGNQFKDGLVSDLEIIGNSIPFRIKLPSAQDHSNVNFTIDQYGKSIFVARMRIFGSFAISNLEQLLPAYSTLLGELKQVSSGRILRTAAAMAAGLPLQHLHPLSKIRTHSYIGVGKLAKDSDFPSAMTRYISSKLNSLIATHITGDHLHRPHPRIQTALTRSNSELNLKSESQLLLVNAQGSTLITGSTPDQKSEYKSPYYNRHSRVIDLSEIATVMQHLLANADNEHDINSREWAKNDRVIKRWISYPSNVFLTSLSNQKLWEVISEAYSLPHLLEEFREIDSHHNN